MVVVRYYCHCEPSEANRHPFAFERIATIPTNVPSECKIVVSVHDCLSCTGVVYLVQVIFLPWKSWEWRPKKRGAKEFDHFDRTFGWHIPPPIANPTSEHPPLDDKHDWESTHRVRYTHWGTNRVSIILRLPHNYPCWPNSPCVHHNSRLGVVMVCCDTHLIERDTTQ